MDNKNKITPKAKIVLLVLLVLILLSAATVCIYLAMRLRLPEQAVVCGVDMSDMLCSDAELLLDEKVNGYSMAVTVDDQVIHITAEDMGLVFLKEEFEAVVQSSVDTGESVDPWSVIELDYEKLSSLINQRFDEKRTAAVPAAIVWNENLGCFFVESCEPETWYSSELLTEMVRDAVAELPAELEIPADALYQEYTDAAQQAEAEALAKKANGLMELELEYVFNPRKVEIGRIVIDSATIASFLRLDLENNTVYADESAVTAYVESFASDYTYSRYKDRFVTHGGDRIELTLNVEEQTVDVDGLTSLIVECIANGTSGSYEVPYDGALNFGGDYIEVSIPEQHLWVYQDGVVVLESDVVTGNEGIGKYTPTGINYIRGHLTDIYLFGDHFVEYWMAFTRGGIYGFHDADHWREPEEYGGTTYQGNGSGGCVNVPVENMAKMYELVPDGTPIMIYNYWHYDGY